MSGSWQEIFATQSEVFVIKTREIYSRVNKSLFSVLCWYGSLVIRLASSSVNLLMFDENKTSLIGWLVRLVGWLTN